MPAPADSMPLSPRWDPWILKDKEIYRLFYLSGRTDQDPWWKTSWICEARSSDMLHWKHLGPVLEPLADKDGEKGWESGRLFAGSAYKEERTYYLFYSAASESDISGEAIGLASSADGLCWQRLDHPLLSFQENSSGESSLALGYAGRCNGSNHLHWRDPYVVQEPITKQYYLFFCASLRGKSFYQGGVGVAVANQIAGPYRLLPPVAGPGVTVADSSVPDATASWPFYHLERPQVIYFQGKYHLFFSCFKEFVNPLWLEKIGSHRVTDSTLYWYVSDEITGPFEPADALLAVPGSEATGLYGTTFSPLPMLEDWQQMSEASSVEMTVLGWYSRDYRLAIAREFRAVWTASSLKIIPNSSR